MPWINSRVVFPKRRAQLVILDDQVNALLLSLAREAHLGQLEAVCNTLCAWADGGRYEGATLHSFHFDMARLCWCLGIAHPCLNAVAPGMQAPELRLTLPPVVLAHLMPHGMDQPPLDDVAEPSADLQRHDGGVNRLDQPNEQADEFPLAPPRMTTEERQFLDITARQPDPDDVE